MFARFCFQKAGDTSLLHHCTPPKLNSMGHNCYLYQKDGRPSDVSLLCSEKSIYNLSSAPATSSLLPLPNLPQPKEEFSQIMLFEVYKMHVDLQACLCCSLFLKTQSRQSHACVSLLCSNSTRRTRCLWCSFPSKIWQTTRTCLCFFPLLKINNTLPDICGALLFPKLSRTSTCLYFFAQNNTLGLDVCGALLCFKISVYMAARLRFKYQQAEMMVVRSNSLDDKACLAMLARIKLDICLFSFSLLDELSVAIQIALKLQMGLKHAHVSGWLFYRYIFSKVTSGETMSVLERTSSKWSMSGGALFLVTFCLTKKLLRTHWMSVLQSYCNRVLCWRVLSFSEYKKLKYFKSRLFEAHVLHGRQYGMYILSSFFLCTRRV